MRTLIFQDFMLPNIPGPRAGGSWKDNLSSHTSFPLPPKPGQRSSSRASDNSIIQGTDRLVDKNFRSHFVDRQQSRASSFTNLAVRPAPSELTASPTVASTTTAEDKCKAKAEQTSSYKNPQQGEAGISPSSFAVIDEEETEASAPPLPRVQSQLSLMIARERQTDQAKVKERHVVKGRYGPRKTSE